MGTIGVVRHLVVGFAAVMMACPGSVSQTRNDTHTAKITMDSPKGLPGAQVAALSRVGDGAPFSQNGQIDIDGHINLIMSLGTSNCFLMVLTPQKSAPWNSTTKHRLSRM